MNNTEFRCGYCNSVVTRFTRMCPSCHRRLRGIECLNCGFTGSETDFINDRCPRCNTEISQDEKRPTFKRDVIISLGAGSSLSCSIVLALSWLNEGWAVFFSGFAVPFLWQLLIIGIVFMALISVLKGVFWSKIETFLFIHSNQIVHDFFTKFRSLFKPLIHHKRVGYILLLILASIITLLILPILFNRPLDIFDIVFNLTINILAALILTLLRIAEVKEAKWERSKNLLR